MLRISYELVSNSVPPLDWDSYSSALVSELSSLLSSGTCEESAYQEFIEHNPVLMPWLYGTFGGGHHGLIYDALVTQPRLPGLKGKQPDFLMLARDTGSVYAVLVEIESPCKRWFTKKGDPSAEFAQALNQIRTWKQWFRRPGNREKFVDEYRVPQRFSEYRMFEQRYILVLGRRAELHQSGTAPLRAEYQQDDERLITYDHLSPSEELRDTITARVTGDGYHALVVPPTVRMGPLQADEHRHLKSRENAVSVHAMMPPTRARFLVERWPYWDAWARSGGGTARMSDWE